MTETKDQCAINQKPVPRSRGEESPVRDKKSPETEVHDEAETENHST